MGLFNAVMSLSGTADTDVIENERLARHTSYRIGGKAALFVVCHSYHALRRAVDVLQKERVPWVIVGKGSNLLVADRGYDGCVITVKNLVAIGNGTGICHAGTAEADHENLYIAGSDSRDFFMLNRRNSFRNVAVEAAAPIYSDIGDRGDAVLENLWFYSAKPGACFRTIRGGTIKAKNVKLFRHTQPGNTPGIEVVKDPAPVLAAIAKQKAELFAIFGGKLEKALADR